MKNCMRLGAAALRLAFTLSLFSFGAQASAAAPPWEGEAFSAKPAALLAAVKGLESKEEWEADILLSDSRYTLEADGRWTERHHRIYVVLDAAEIDAWAVFEHPWSPWFQKRPEMRARVISPAGREFQLDPQTISEESIGRSSDVLFDDDRMLRAPLPGVEVGALVETEVVVRDERPMFVGGSVRRVALYEDHYRLARISVDAAETAGLRWLARKLPANPPAETTEKGRQRLRFEYRDLEGTTSYVDGLPSSEAWYPYLALSSGKSWSDVAKSYAAVVDRTLAGAEVSRAVATATRGAQAQTEVVDRLLAYLQKEVRYTGVEFGDASLVPRSPAETLSRRFGDCKDKSALLVALLRAADIPAYLALLSIGPGQDVDPDLPGLGVFDHAIVYIPASPPIWIDATDEFARAGELPFADRDRLALIASGSTRGLVRTPPATSAENVIRRTRTIHMAEIGPARLIEDTEFRGQAERDARRTYGLADDAKRKEWAKSYAENYHLAEAVDKVEVTPANDLTRPFHLRLEMPASKRGIADLDEAAVGIRYDELLERLPYALRLTPDEDEEARKDPYVFIEPSITEWHYEIHPPKGFEPRGLPESRDESLGTASLSRRYRTRPDGVVEIDFRLDSGKMRLTPSEYAAYREKASALANGEPLLLYFDQIGAQKLADGDLAGAIHEFRRLAEVDPKNAVYPLQISRALLAAGLGTAARDAAKKAVALDPKSSLAQNQLGWVLQHDELGRLREGEFDREGAIAAYREALRLDSDAVLPKADLAILLEYDARGRRYTHDTNLEEAGKLYRELFEANQTGFSTNLMINLAYRGRFAELRDFTAKLQETLEQRQFRAVAVAALEGGEAGVRVTRGVDDRQQRAQVLAGAAQYLLRARRYREAKALLEAALPLQSEGKTNSELLVHLGSVKKWDEVPTPPREPGTLLSHLLLGLMRQEIKPSQAESFLSRKMSPALRKKELEELSPEKVAESMSSLGGTLPLDVTLDLAISLWTPKVDGDDAIGYRVQVGLENAEFSYYVVREEGEYRLIVLANDNQIDLAHRALEAANAGNLEAAKRWLGWLYDERIKANLEKPEPSDDPYAKALQARRWELAADADLAQAREVAANYLMASVSYPLDEAEKSAAEKALATFEELQRTAEGERAAMFDTSRWGLLQVLDRPQELLPLAERLYREKPESEGAFVGLLATLVELDRLADAERVAQERQKAKPKDWVALRFLADLDEHRGNLAASTQKIAPLLKGNEALPHDYNRLAWDSLFVGSVDDEAIERAEKACEMTSELDPSLLHTLATLYAERGRQADAYRTILKALTLHNDGEPMPHDWYVFARIAESLGLPDLAKSYYRKVEPDEGKLSANLSTFELAKRRIATLGGSAAGESKGKKKR